MAEPGTFDEVFRRLREILSRQVPPLVVTSDDPDDYSVSVDRPDVMPESRRYFGGVRSRKTYVSYYLMGVYTDPRLVAEMSPGLRKRMQGKACFNFAKVDEVLFGELATLTERTAAGYPTIVDAFSAAKR